MGVAQHTALFDTIAAVVAALVIIPACFSYGLDVGAGPSLLFVTLPTILQDIPLGQLFAVILYIAMIFAGVSSLQKHVRGRGGIAPAPVPPAEPHRYPHHPGRTVPWLRHRYGDHLPMGAVDGSCFHLYHPHRRYAGRCFLVLCNEKRTSCFRPSIPAAGRPTAACGMASAGTFMFRWLLSCAALPCL